MINVIGASPTPPNPLPSNPLTPPAPANPESSADNSMSSPSSDSGGTKKSKRKLPLKYVLGGVALFLLLIGGGAGLYLMKTQQDLRQQASTLLYDTPTSIGSSCTINNSRECVDISETIGQCVKCIDSVWVSIPNNDACPVGCKKGAEYPTPTTGPFIPTPTSKPDETTQSSSDPVAPIITPKPDDTGTLNCGDPCETTAQCGGHLECPTGGGVCWDQGECDTPPTGVSNTTSATGGLADTSSSTETTSSNGDTTTSLGDLVEPTSSSDDTSTTTSSTDSSTETTDDSDDTSTIASSDGGDTTTINNTYNYSDGETDGGQPDLPAELPETGPEDWLNYLKIGLGSLGVGAILLLFL